MSSSPTPTAPSAAHSRLQNIQWAAFDLDDTIHEFRLASRAASQAVFEVIQREHNIPIEDLQADYSAILATHTANAFSDGRTSTEYRRDRFEALLRGREGPRDAQEWTLEQLGVLPYVDILATSNDVGKTKVDGLVWQVIRGAGLNIKDGVYIGDNLKRDVLPAIAEGIDAVHFKEAGMCWLGYSAVQYRSYPHHGRLLDRCRGSFIYDI
ncbi:hypothetical protein BDV19DRAFT_383421 [Aspergillus venezuelensis]